MGESGKEKPYPPRAKAIKPSQIAAYSRHLMLKKIGEMSQEYIIMTVDGMPQLKRPENMLDAMWVSWKDVNEEFT